MVSQVYLSIAQQTYDNKLVYLSKMAVLQEQPYSPKASWVNQPQDTQQVYNMLASYQNTIDKQIKE